MERKYKLPTPSKKLALVGNNFILNTIYNNFKRYSKLKTYIVDSSDELNFKVDFIIDCSFNENTQNNSIGYSIKNNIDKLILLNHWGRNLPNNTVPIIQLVLPDIYSEEHESFNRPGMGNRMDSDVNYCTLICETIRRVHESKLGGVPNTYINYGENSIRYIHVNNIYEPILKALEEIDESSIYDVYDEEKTPGFVLKIIKNVIDYNGEIIFHNTNSNYNKKHTRLTTNNIPNFESNIRRIYKTLLINNERFVIY